MKNLDGRLVIFLTFALPPLFLWMGMDKSWVIIMSIVSFLGLIYWWIEKNSSPRKEQNIEQDYPHLS